MTSAEGRPVRGRPAVGVVAAGAGATEAVRPLVRALARHVDVRAADRAGAADAWLVAGAEALDQVPGGPVAVADGGRLAAGGVTWALAAGATIDTAAWPPITPHVRRRWRQRLGLADDLVVATADLAAEDVPTALGVAAAAVVDADHLPLALALGCPSVVSSAAAASVGAQDGVHVVVGERAAADVLAADAHRAARLSRSGRLHAVGDLDPARTAEELLRVWGLAPVGPVARLDERLAELGTAGAGPIRHRVADALTLLAPSAAAPPSAAPPSAPTAPLAPADLGGP